MGLPKVNVPEYDLELPSSGERVTYRPFLVGEEKVLYMAMESKDPVDVARTVTNVVQDCVTTEGVDVRKLPSFDMEYLFINLRARSVGETAKVGILHEKEECQAVTPVEVDLTSVEVRGTDNQPDDKILLPENENGVGVVMRYPTLEDVNRVSEQSEDAVEKAFLTVARCIRSVFDEEQVYEDFTKDEITEWLSSLSQTQFSVLLEWFRSMPTLEHTITYTCEGCGEEDEVVLRGLMSFFE